MVDFNDPDWLKKQMEAQRAARQALLAKPANATYATHDAEGLNDKPWQIETTLQHPGNRQQYVDSLKAAGVSGPELTKAIQEYQNRKDAFNAQEQRNKRSMIVANRGGDGSTAHLKQAPYSGAAVPTATSTTGAAPVTTSNDDLKKFYDFLATDAGKEWAAKQPAAETPKWTAPAGYTTYGDDKSGITLPTGTDYKDSLLRAGFMHRYPVEMMKQAGYDTSEAEKWVNNNPYYPKGSASSGNLSLGGSAAESYATPDGLPGNPAGIAPLVSAPPKPQASGPASNAGSGATSNADLKAFLEYLAGRAGNASPVSLPEGRAQQQAQHPLTPLGRPNYGTVVQKGLL